MRDVWSGIGTARLVLVELTGRNANVLYELGLAHALGKPFVIITNSMDDVPFDLKDLRCIVYDKDHPKWGDALGRNVTRTMRSVLQEASSNEPLFPGIETDVRYEPVEEKGPEVLEAEKEQFPSVTGNWEFKEEWERVSNKRTTMILQQDGGSVSGYATSISDDPDTEKWVVNQEVSGFVREKQIELVATSYQIVESGGDADFGWYLDTWKGTLENENFIRGEMVAENAKGTFWGEKVITE